MKRRASAVVVVVVTMLARAGLARADEGEGPSVETTPAAAAKAEPATKDDRGLVVTPQGYVEVYYAYNLNRPSNGITNFRGFDNRHDTFSLSNVALGASFASGPVGGKVMFQVGSTPSSYYAAETVRAGAAGANATGPELWKYLQEAYLSYEAPVGRGLSIQAGLVASPIGMEQFAVKDHWTWSRSNLFYGLPYYHTGVRATYAWSDAWSTTVSVFNGWNSVVDNNEEKSVQTNVTYKPNDDVLVSALYFGGVERETGSPEGPWWRHHFDLVASAKVVSFLSAAAQLDYGFEPNRFGTARWIAGAAAARAEVVEKRLFFVVRGDRFVEHLATDARGGASTPLFWNGSEWVSSLTTTLDFRPHDNVSFRLEGRHDVSEAPLYFGRNVVGDGSAATPYVANARTQDTLLVGATAWF